MQIYKKRGIYEVDIHPLESEIGVFITVNVDGKQIKQVFVMFWLYNWKGGKNTSLTEHLQGIVC